MLADVPVSVPTVPLLKHTDKLLASNACATLPPDPVSQAPEPAVATTNRSPPATPSAVVSELCDLISTELELDPKGINVETGLSYFPKTNIVDADEL